MWFGDFVVTLHLIGKNHLKVDIGKNQLKVDIGKNLLKVEE